MSKRNGRGGNKYVLQEPSMYRTRSLCAAINCNVDKIEYSEVTSQEVVVNFIDWWIEPQKISSYS